MLFKNQSFEKTDSYILVICFLCIFTSSSWLIYDLMFNSYDLKGNIPIGKITKISNHVKRKFNRSLIWYDVSQRETVFENDWVFTGSNSQTTIEFDDGGELIVDPDSLIILTRENGALKLNLQHGSMLANVSSDVKVNVLKNGKLQKVKNTKKRILSKKKAPPIKRVVRKIKSNISLKTPSDFETLWIKDGQSVNFSWTSDPLLKEYKFELSKDKEFSKPLSKVFTKNSINLKIKSTTPFYWRVSDNQNPQSRSSINNFNIKYNKPPLPTLVLQDGEKLTIPKKNGKIPAIELPWEDTQNSWSRFDIQVAKDSSFSETLFENSTEKNIYLFNVKEDGTYYWRVRGQDSYGEVVSSWSETQKLPVSIKSDIKKKIFLTQKNIIVDIDESDFNKISSTKVISKSFEIKWSTNFKAPSYRIQLSKTTNFNEKFEDTTSSKKSITLNEIPSGVSYYRIIAENKLGKPDLISSKGQIITYFSKPTKLSNDISPKNHNLTWSHLPSISSYQVNYTDENNSSFENSFAQKNQLLLPNNKKPLKWRVRAVDKLTKTPLSDYSDYQLSTPPPEKKLASVKKPENPNVFPIITSPARRKTFVAVGSNPIFIVMKWIYKSTADAYDVEVSTSPDMENIVYKKKVHRKKRAVINQSFKPGKYYMRVRALENNAAKAWSNVEVFRVKAP